MSSLSTGSKKKLLKEVNGRCFYCGIKLIEENTTWDHIIPISKNGRGTMKNYCVSCRGCNAIKYDRQLEKFRDIMERSLEIEYYQFYFEKIGLNKTGEEYE